MFEDVFTLDSRSKLEEPFARVSRPPRRAFVPGVYSNGLITLLGQSFPLDWMDDWPPLAGRMEPFAYTAFGDVFCWDKQKNCPQFLRVQYAKMNRVLGESVDEALDGLVNQDVLDELLRRDFVEQLNRHLGPLEYGQCYIAQPWEMLGGGGKKPERYDRGAVDVYLSMVGQTHPFR